MTSKMCQRISPLKGFLRLSVFYSTPDCFSALALVASLACTLTTIFERPVNVVVMHRCSIPTKG